MGRGWNLFVAGLLAIMMALPLSASGTGPAPVNEGRATATEGLDTDSQNNDDFLTAQQIGNGDFLEGTTGLDDPHRCDMYVLRDVPAGKVVNASCLVTNFDSGAGDGVALQLTGWNRCHADILAWSNREDNPDRRPWEALSFLCVVSGDYFIQLKPIAGAGAIIYRLSIQAFDPEDITDKIGTGGAFGATITGQVSSYKWYPGQWYRFTMTGEQDGMNDYLYVNMTEPGSPEQRLWGDIYVRNLEEESYSYWLNHSWWLDSFVQYEEVHAAACHPGPKTYYLDVQAYNTSGGRSEDYELKLTRTLVESDGDNHPLNATPVNYENGKTTIRKSGRVERGPDMFDWCKVKLDKGEGVSATLTLLERVPAIFRLSIYQDNLTRGYDLMSSWTNKPGDTVLNRVNTLATNVSQAGWYYIGVIAQIGLMPTNTSNLCDWTALTARSGYNLDVSLPYYSAAPSVVNPPPPITMAEGGSDSSLRLNFTGGNNGVFTDADLAEEWGDSLEFSTGGHPNCEVSIAPTDEDLEATVTIRPERYWNGEANITFMATDLYGKSNSVVVNVRVTQVNDPPFVKARILDFTVFEGTVNNNMKDIDLFSVFGDPDFPPYGDDKLTFSVDTSQHAASITENKLTFGAAPRFPGKETHVLAVAVSATDKAKMTALQTVNITVIQLWIPPEPKDCRIEILEDEVSYFELHLMFDNPDGDPLTFSYLGGATDNLTVVVAPNGTAILTPVRNYFTTQEILKFKAVNPLGSNRTGELVVRIKNVPDPPEPHQGGLIPDPFDDIRVDEGAAITFRVAAADVDTKASELRYTWFLDGSERTRLGAPAFSWMPAFDDAGRHVVKVRVNDGLGYFDAEWNVTVQNVNRAPVVLDSWPINNTVVGSGARVTFRACATDPDGDPLTFFWRLSDGTLLRTESRANSSAFSRSLAPGLHIIVLDVEDGQGGVARQYIYVKIEQTENPPIDLPWVWIGGVAAAIILIAATASIWRRKGRRPPDRLLRLFCLDVNKETREQVDK